MGTLLPARAYTGEVQVIDTIRSTDPAQKDFRDMLCPPDTWFGQAPDLGIAVGDDGIAYLLQGFPPTSGPVNAISWWMNEQVPNSTQFDLFLFEDNGGAPGKLLKSFPNVTVARVETGEMFGSNKVVEYTFSLPSPIAFPSGGWFGVRDLPTTRVNAYWILSGSGTHTMYVFDDSGEFSPRNFHLSICVDADVIIPVPLAGWAVFAALLLIATFIVLRGRRWRSIPKL